MRRAPQKREPVPRSEGSARLVGSEGDKALTLDASFPPPAFNPSGVLCLMRAA
jgi:hypothetical protein